MRAPILEGIDFGSLDDLREIDKNRTNRKNGPSTLPLSSIMEDPNQPRRGVDEAKLAELADSIRERGVLQAVTVRPANADGKHVIVMGARRYRASLLAGKETIPAVIRSEASDGYDQMIENIQREALSHNDIAAFIRNELSRGAKKSAIAKNLGKPPSWVSPYVDFFDMDPVIQTEVERYGIRAAEELHKAMQIDMDATRAFMASGEPITQRSAVAFRQSLKSEQDSSPSPIADDVAMVEPTGSVDAAATPMHDVTPVTERPRQTAVPIPEAEVGPEAEAKSSPDAGEAIDHANAPGEGLALALAGSHSQRDDTAPLVLLVRVGGRIGRLLLDREAKQGSGYGAVLFAEGAEEARLSDLAMVEIVKAQGKESDDD